VNRLSRKTLGSLPGNVVTPAYSPGEHDPGIVHIGLGAFHRAHQAVYTDTALASGGGDWRIIGSSLRSRTLLDQLAAQDNLYTVVARDADHEECRVINAISDLIYAPDKSDTLLRAMADSRIKIVTLTVTEKGYCYDPGRQGLDQSNELVQSDLQNPESPRSAPGYLVAGLRHRMRQDAGPVTVLNCDNLPDNGSITRNVVAEMAEAVDPELATWIEHNVTFPSSVVDRIVPATTENGREHVAELLGVSDRCPVLTESFSQWVIEDDFAAGRPAWEDGGAIFVSSVAPFERMKLRLLNGSHSTMAYLGSVAGIRYIHEVIAETPLRTLVRTLMDREVTPTLSVSDFDLDSYKNQLVHRFANASLNDETRRIAMDGSQKLPQRLLDPIRERLTADQPIDCLLLSVAAWMRYVGGPDESGTPIDVDDPMAEKLDSIRRRHGNSPPDLAKALISIRPIFGDDLPDEPRFVTGATDTLKLLFDKGVFATVDSVLGKISADRGP
jgi:fructuronate reductase